MFSSGLRPPRLGPGVHVVLFRSESAEDRFSDRVPDLFLDLFLSFLFAELRPDPFRYAVRDSGEPAN